jgi:fibronectin-binding autotransporter adhesin
MPSACVLRLLFFCLVALALPTARAQLVWGSNGAGGDGTWNVNPGNKPWFNGTTQVAWPAFGTAATFGGTGGNITVSAVAATSLTFVAGGYTLGSASETPAVLTANSATLTFDTQAATAVSLTSVVGAGSTTFVKQGDARLALNAALTGFSNVQVSAGELAVGGSTFSNSSTRFTLGDVASAVLSFDISTLTAIIDGLAGGGANGGVVRPGGIDPLTLTLAGSTDASFAGSLQDNGSTSLLLLKLGPANQTLTAANPYTGATVVAGGRLTLAGSGSILNSAITISAGGTLALDNTGTLLPSRLGDTRPLILSGGTLLLIGNGSATTAETAGSVSLGSGQSRIEIIRTSGQAASFSFTTLNRLGGGAALEFAGDGPARITSGANTNGILGGYAVIGNDWAALDGSKNVVAFSSYASSLTSGAVTDNVRLTAAQTLSAATTTRNSLALDSSGGDFALDLGAAGNSLRLTSGGLLVTGAGTATITGGQITSNNTARDLVAFVRGNLAVSTPIVDVTNSIGPIPTTSAITLTKAGEGTLTLSGANTYTGDTRVLAGTLSVTSGAAIPNTSTVTLSPGATFRLGGSTETIGGLSGSGSVLFENGQLTVGGSGLNGAATIALGSGRLTLTAAGNTDFAGTLSGSGGLTHAGTGTLTLSAAQAFTGALRIASGSLLLLDEGINLLADSTPLELTGGTFGFSPNLIGLGAETLGTLTVGASSFLQLHSSTTLPTAFVFADSSTLTWTGALRVTNYTTSLDSLRIGTSAGALTAQQLGLISFEIDGSVFAAQINSLGFVTPAAIPEPAATTLILAGAAFGFAGYFRRRRQRA